MTMMTIGENLFNHLLIVYSITLLFIASGLQCKKKRTRLYVCGNFSGIESYMGSQYLAAFNAKTGEFIDWKHDRPNSDVQQIEIADSL